MSCATSAGGLQAAHGAGVGARRSEPAQRARVAGSVGGEGRRLRHRRRRAGGRIPTAPSRWPVRGLVCFCTARPNWPASGEASERSDVYSLGVIAYEAMTGKLPVGRFSLPSDANKQVPLELDPIVLKCLAADPAQRYQSVAAFVADLDKVEQVVDYQLINELKRLSGGRLFTRKEARNAARSGRPGPRSTWDWPRCFWSPVP